jgi:sortase A
MMMIIPAAIRVNISAPTQGAERFGFTFGGGCLRARFDLLLGMGADSTEKRAGYISSDSMAALRFFGKFLISVGFGVLLFVLWTLYGTGIITARHQNALADEFDAQAAFPESDQGGSQGETRLRATGPPIEFQPDKGEVVFRLKIAEMNLDMFVVEGVDAPELEKGPGHYPECDDEFEPPFCTDLPEKFPGDRGRVIVSAHRTTFDAPFNDLDVLQKGDEIITETKWGTFRYVVDRREIVDDEDVQVTQELLTRDRELVLTTCHPKFSAAQRMVVYSTLEERIE